MPADPSSQAARPATTAELAEILAGDTRAFETIGSGSKRAVGRSVDAEPLQLSDLSGIVDYRPAELVLTAQAATPIGSIADELRQNGQQLAFEPPDFGALLAGPEEFVQARDSRGTIGGVLATNLSGSRRIAAGSARDHFLGVTAVNGRGDVFKAGGQVVKNVTGYDLPRLLAGSWGSLAVMTELTLKVVPAPETERTLIVPFDRAGQAVDLLAHALGSAHEVSGAAWDPWRGAAVRLEGFAASVAARRSALLGEIDPPEVEELEGTASAQFWSDLGSARALADWPVVWRISVPPADAPRVIEAIAPERYLLDWGGGLIWAAFPKVDSPRVRGALREGHAMLFKAPADTRVCRQQPAAAALGAVLERLRDAFDPDRRLNPGRMD